ncbi:hypothetical protein [Haloimpatiens lingqiaonensis]|uniref:hypothetical protein n=1 Tax=Haloimpatiens lingqiaonensis TaxID=1380675 RepID=UPI0010FEC205|nr:hypothetical protein [Haloimpatiens lingqiaonensis]
MDYSEFKWCLKKLNLKPLDDIQITLKSRKYKGKITLISEDDDAGEGMIYLQQGNGTKKIKNKGIEDIVVL